MKQTLQHLFWCFAVFFLLAVIACEAPHKNPLDPENPSSPYVAVEGVLEDFGRQPVPNAEVRWKPSGNFTRTGSNGFFSLFPLLPEAGVLSFEAPGFHPDSLAISWSTARKQSVSRVLNRKPQLHELETISLAINKFPSGRDVDFRLRARVEDRDNQMDSVLWAVPGMGLSGRLTDGGGGWFETTFRLNATNEEPVGRPFLVSVASDDGRITAVGQQSVVRVIQTEILTTEPRQNNVVGSRPEFRWERPGAAFAFTCRVEVFREVQFDEPEQVFRSEELAPDITEYTPANPLPTLGDHFWVLWIRDQFGNEARSRPLSFVVAE